jgi:hypothetical protein
VACSWIWKENSSNSSDLAPTPAPEPGLHKLKINFFVAQDL